MENQISAKLSRTEAFSNRSVTVQPATPGSSGAAHDLFEQFLVMPTEQRPVERPDARESTSDEEPREATAEKGRESRVESEDDAPRGAEKFSESNESEEAVDPLLVTNSLAVQEQTITPEQTTDAPTDALDADLNASGVHQPASGQEIVQATDDGEIVAVDDSEQSEEITDSQQAEVVDDGPKVIAPQQTVEFQESQIEAGQAQSSDEAAASALPADQQPGQDDLGDQADQTPTAKIENTASTTRRDTNREDQQAQNGNLESRPEVTVESAEGEEPEAKWFQQPAANPLYSAAPNGDVPISQPPVDSSAASQNDNQPPGLEHPVEVAAEGVPGEFDPSERSPRGVDQTSAGGRPPVESLPTNMPLARTPSQTGPTASSAGSQSDAATPVTNSSARPDTGGQVRTSGPSVAPGTPTAEAPDVNQHERIRLIQRVSRSFSRLTPTGGEISLRLHPPQLGSLAVKVQMEGSSLSARMSTETEAAREIIMESLPVLRKRLAEQGIEVTQMHVDVSDGSSDSSLAGSGSDSSAQDRQADQRAQQRAAQYRQAITARSVPVPQVATVTSTPAASQGWVAATSIDVHA